MRKIYLSLSVVFLMISALVSTRCALSNRVASDKRLSSLREGFANPPCEARPYVWWHWMNGNITKDGIRKDLEWMDRVGIVGFHHFDAAISTPTIVDKRLIYMQDDWKDAFAYAVKVADSLNMEMTVASSPGWSTTGGPWVEPEDAMKKIVWRTVDVEGGKKLSMKLPAPIMAVGRFQDENVGTPYKGKPYYGDIAVVAVRQPEGRAEISAEGVKLAVSGGNFTYGQLTDGSFAGAGTLISKDRKAWIEYSFPQEVTVRSVSLASDRWGILESSEDGSHFKKVADLNEIRGVQKTINIPATTAKHFRVTLNDLRSSKASVYSVKVSEFKLFPYSKVNSYEDKAGYSSVAHVNKFPTAINGEVVPSEEDVVLLSDFTDSFGNLDWNAPSGKWRIYRFGWSLTGKCNHPAPDEATGLEVDKMDPEAWTKYFHEYLDMYKDASGGMLGQEGIQYILNDSYEAGQENWTPAMFGEFSRRRGYDMRKWLPAIAGEIIGSPERSDAFLHDFRMTIGELVAENYDLLTKILQDEYGMKGRYTESHEAGRAYIVDGMDVKRTAQIPMSATWCNDPRVKSEIITGYNTNGKADCKESSSVAHIYGQNIAAAESMTVNGEKGNAYVFCPETLKLVADRELSGGINRFVIHESAHQPDDEHVPGLSLGKYGQWFNRHETWAEMAGTWMDYLARSCYMLQAGQNVADILYYYGEDGNVTGIFGSEDPAIPSGFQWDYCSPDVLLNQISFKNGKLVAGSGVSYKILWMDKNMEYVSVPVLRKIDELAKAGAIIGGKRAQRPSGLSDDQAAFDALVKDIWDAKRANVYEVGSLAELVEKAGIEPQVVLPYNTRFLHRTDNGVEIFWVNRPLDTYCDTSVVFNVSGMKPQIWHPDDGTIEDASYKCADGKTTVSLHLTPIDAVFVVFAGKGEAQHAVPGVQTKELARVSAPWNVSFQENRGAPESAVFENLQSFTESEDPEIKYFSGVATYSNTVNVPDASGKIILDLGSVKNIAEVKVNGIDCGRAWKEPFVVDVTSAVKLGENQLEIKVANLWANRIIGDLQPGAKKIAWIDYDNWFAKDSQLLPAGLLGPVKIIQKK